MTDKTQEALDLAMVALELEWTPTMGANHPFTKALAAIHSARSEQPAQQRHISYVCPQCYWSLEEQPAQQQEPEYKGWYCAHCERGVDGSEVTYHEQHAICGRVITDDVPPKARQKELQACSCRWDGDTQVQQCTLHQAHVAAIHEWAERAKAAEAKLKAQPQQEPVLCINPKVIDPATGKVRNGAGALTYSNEPCAGWSMPLYEHPPAQRKPWVGLTDEQRHAYDYLGPDVRHAIMKTEAKLREKNA